MSNILICSNVLTLCIYVGHVNRFCIQSFLKSTVFQLFFPQSKSQFWSIITLLTFCLTHIFITANNCLFCLCLSSKSLVNLTQECFEHILSSLSLCFILQCCEYLTLYSINIIHVSSSCSGAHGIIIGWGTMLQAGRLWVQFPMRSFNFSIDPTNFSILTITHPREKQRCLTLEKGLRSRHLKEQRTLEPANYLKGM
jgi:hypothetical protein